MLDCTELEVLGFWVEVETELLVEGGVTVVVDGTVPASGEPLPGQYGFNVRVFLPPGICWSLELKKLVVSI